MVQDSPLRKCLEDYAASAVLLGESLRDEVDRPGAARGDRVAVSSIEYLPYGSPSAADGPVPAIVGTLGEVEAEYAAVRRGAAIFDAPHRATLLVTGGDRIDFLNRMLTQELDDLAAGHVRRAFLLTRQGRIAADLMLAEFGALTLVDVDIHQASNVLERLESSIFTEDVEIREASERMHRLEVHGPMALDLVGAASDASGLALENGSAVSLALGADAELFVARSDTTGSAGLHLFLPRDRAEAVWSTLIEKDAEIADGKRRVRPIGWFAFNMARIEAGTPLMNVDFGPSNLPHETGVLRDRVSFTTGCYPGQEVVARMENLGKPKQMLIGLRIEGDLLPTAGDPVLDPGAGEGAKPTGTITSSCLSPMLGAVPVAFAMIRLTALSENGSFLVQSAGSTVAARHHELRFLGDTTGQAPPAGTE